MKESKAEKKDKDGREAGRGRKFACSDDRRAGVWLGSLGARERPPVLEEFVSSLMMGLHRWAQAWLPAHSFVWTLLSNYSWWVCVCVCEGEWVGERGRERGTGVEDVGRREHTSRWQDEERNLWQILGTIRHNVSAAWQLIRNNTDFSQCNRCCLISPARENPAPATFHAQFNHLKGMKYLMHCKASTAVSLVWKFPSQKYACFM